LLYTSGRPRLSTKDIAASRLVIEFEKEKLTIPGRMRGGERAPFGARERQPKGTSSNDPHSGGHAPQPSETPE